MTTYKILDIKVLDRRKDGGRIVISTGTVDRDKDRVFPQGGKIDDYMRNPVVQFAHNYYDPWATVGRSKTLEVTETGIIADFELRPAANEADPQNIILLLWDKDFIRAASIGFMPETTVPNDLGGVDFVSWSLLEWSICAVPANQDALRLAADQFPAAFKAYQAEIAKGGRVLSAANERKIRQAHEHLDQAQEHLSAVLESVATDDDGKVVSGRRAKAAPVASGGADLAWVRRLEVVSAYGPQQLYAVFRAYTIDVPKDAMVLRCDDDGNIIERPDPNAGKTVACKEVSFVPPLAFDDDTWGEDALYGISGPDQADDDMVVSRRQEWEVAHLSEVINRIPATKALKVRHLFTSGIEVLTQRGLNRAKAVIRRKSPPVVVPVDNGISDEEVKRLLDGLSGIPV